MTSYSFAGNRKATKRQDLHSVTFIRALFIEIHETVHATCAKIIIHFPTMHRLLFSSILPIAATVGVCACVLVHSVDAYIFMSPTDTPRWHSKIYANGVSS